MVEMEVGRQRDLDVGDRQAERRQVVREIARAIDGVDIHVLGRHLAADAAVDEHQPFAAHQQRP